MEAKDTVMSPHQIDEAVVKGTMWNNIACQGCVFLLHYEQDRKGWLSTNFTAPSQNESRYPWNLPRCAIEFRDGSQVNHPCQDKIKSK